MSMNHDVLKRNRYSPNHVLVTTIIQARSVWTEMTETFTTKVIGIFTQMVMRTLELLLTIYVCGLFQLVLTRYPRRLGRLHTF